MSTLSITQTKDLHQGALSYLIREDKWERYYYVLNKDGTKLRAYKDATLKMPIIGVGSEINVGRLKDPYDVSLADHLNDTHIYGFSLIFGNETIYLAAPTPNSRQDWIDKLQTAIRSKKEKNLVSVLADHLRTETTTADEDRKSTESNLVEKAIDTCEIDSLALLDLSGLKLREFPVLRNGSLQKRIPRLPMINLSFNELTKCPSEVIGLKFLETISFMGCRLSEFPSELRKCPKLTELNLQGNLITKIPREVGYITSLEKLRMNNNKLTTIDDALGCLRKLDELILTGNGSLSDLPFSIAECKWLKVLDISDCAFTKLPMTVTHCKNLLELNIANNKIITLPDDFGRLENLGVFNCADNQLITLPPSLGVCSNLRSTPNGLNISRNPFHDERNVEKWRVGIDEFMDFMEELLIEYYGAFPRYEPFEEPPPRVLPPLRDEQEDLPLSQKQTSYGISKEVQDQMNRVKQQQANSLMVTAKKAGPRTSVGNNSRPAPGTIPAARPGSAFVQYPRAAPQQLATPSFAMPGTVPMAQSSGNSSDPEDGPRVIVDDAPGMDDLDMGSVAPTVAVPTIIPTQFDEKSRLADFNSVNASAKALSKLINSVPIEQRGSQRPGSQRPLPKAPSPTSQQASASESQPLPAISSLVSEPGRESPKVSRPPAPNVPPRDRKMLSEWADTTLEVMIAKVSTEVSHLEGTSNASELVRFVNLVKVFKPYLPLMNQYVMLSTSTPPPSDDKFLRAKMIVSAGLNDIVNALEAFLKWINNPKTVDEQFFAGADIVREIKDALSTL